MIRSNDIFTSFLLTAMITAGCASGGGTSDVYSPKEPTASPAVCSASLVDISGKHIELTLVTSPNISLGFSTAPYEGLYLVELDLPVVHKITLSPDKETVNVTFRDDTQLSGTPYDNLAGTNDLGDYRIPWKEIQEIAFSCENGAKQFSPPSGTQAFIRGAESDLLILYDLQVKQNFNTYIEGTNLYYHDESIDRLLTVNETNDGKIFVEYKIPMAYVTSISIANGVEYVSPTLGKQRIRGQLHSWVMDSALTFKGVNQYGTWYIYPNKITAAEFKQLNSTSLDQEPDTSQKIGNCTTWAGDELPMIDADVKSIQLMIGAATQEIEWGKIKELHFTTENSWLLSDGYSREPYWLNAEITLINGDILAGKAYIPYGYITAERSDGIKMYLRLYAFSDITIDR